MRFLFVLYATFTTTWVTLGLLLTFWINPRWMAQYWEDRWLHAIAGFLWHILRIRWRIAGLDTLPKNQGYLLACRHQSLWETLVLAHILANVRFVLKRELTWIPVWGIGALLAGHISIDRRQGRKSYEKLLVRAGQVLRSGKALLLFPEGTRTQPGTRLRLRSGVVRLAEALEVPIYPIALNAGVYMPKHGRWRSGTIAAEVLPPMRVNKGEVHEVVTQLGLLIHDHSERLEAQAKS